jgi:hypothetical protein
MKDGRLRVVYVIHDPKRGSKVGITTNLAERLRWFTMGLRKQTRLVWHTEPRVDAPLIETAAHLALLRHHTGGEWFAIHPDAATAAVLDAIRAVERGEVSGLRRITVGKWWKAAVEPDPLVHDPATDEVRGDD